MLNAYIYDGLRSPIGRHGGVLASIRPDDLAAEVIKKLIEKQVYQGQILKMLFWVIRIRLAKTAVM